VLEFLIWLFIGILIGTLCGLLPGVHPNVFVTVILGASLTFALNPSCAAVFLVTAGIVNSFVSFIPAILLGAPEDDSALSVLPGHKLLMLGRGYEAIKLTVFGSFGSVLFTILTLPLFALIVPTIYHAIRPFIHWLLAFVVVYMILTERTVKGKFFAVFTFIFAGLLGLISLNTWSNMLFPLLSGLFGLPVLLLSFRRKTKLPEHVSFEQECLQKRTILSGIGIGSLAGIIAGLLPGIGSAQATVLAQQVTKEKTKEIAQRKFLIAIGSVTTADIIYSILALWLIGNPRSGIAVGIQKLIEVNFNYIALFLMVALIASGAAAYFTLKISKKAIFLIKRVDYSKLSLGVFLFICAMALYSTGLIGLIITFIALSIGLIPNLTGIKRSHAMGVLILPTIAYFILT